jgi:hypothetical protein
MFVSRSPQGFVRTDGSTPLTSIWNVGNQRLTGLATPAAISDAATKGYVDAAAPSGVILADGTVPFTGDQSLGGFRVINLGTPSANNDAATKNYVDTNAVPPSRTVTGTSPVSVNGVNTPVALSGNVTVSVNAAGSGQSGVVTSGAQSFSGTKTFLDGLIVSSPSTIASADNLVFNVPTTYQYRFQINSITRITVQTDGALDLGTNLSAGIGGSLLLKNFAPVLSQDSAGTNLRIVIGLDNTDTLQIGDANTGKPAALNTGLVFRQQSVNDTNATIAVTANLVRITGLTATRTLTLPAASDVNGMFPIKVKDETGAASPTVQILIQPPSGTIEGSANVAIEVGYGSIDLYSNGSAWFIA